MTAGVSLLVWGCLHERRTDRQGPRAKACKMSGHDGPAPRWKSQAVTHPPLPVAFVGWVSDADSVTGRWLRVEPEASAFGYRSNE